jgi:hypothetical protein
MDETLRHQRDTSLGQLDALIRRGREIAVTRSVDMTRVWQTDCAAAVNQLSGGSKAHWLARAYGDAFMVRSATGGVVVEADATEIVERILGVLAQAVASLSRMDDVTVASSGAPPRPRRFDFVHDVDLRPVLEQAYAENGRASAAGDVRNAFLTACGVLEAIITDALEHCGSRISDFGIADFESRRDGPRNTTIQNPDIRNPQSKMTFEARIAAAESAGLIRGGCARLPPAARHYRDLAPDTLVSERDARVVRQVLNVVMRDLDPGR